MLTFFIFMSWLLGVKTATGLAFGIVFMTETVALPLMRSIDLHSQ